MNSRQGCLLLLSAVISALFISGCASGRKQKLEQREKLAASSGLYCDFVNGDKHKEVELELNVLMAKKCDSDKTFSITNYKTPADVTGVLYCCAIRKHEAQASAETRTERFSAPTQRTQPRVEAKPAPKVDAKPEAVTAPVVAPAKDQPLIDKKATQPQNNKSDLEDEVVPL